MGISDLIIAKSNFNKGQLDGSVVIVTGGGGGIGYEAARSLLWLGAAVILAEIDRKKGKAAEQALHRDFGSRKACFCYTDLTKENSIKKLIKFAKEKFGKIDAVINNATIAPTGAVHQVGIKTWDASYMVNLRGPVLLATYLLPEMLKKGSGTMVFVPSSGAAPYLGAYEVFKTAQVELCNTLAGELEGSGVKVFSVGPGIVKTETADAAIQRIAPMYGKTVEEFYQMNEKMFLTPEQAGAGFAAAIAMADKYNGLEVSSLQALIDCGINLEEEAAEEECCFTEEKLDKLRQLFGEIKRTFEEQAEGWSKRPVFERQWVLRDFKKSTGAAPEHFIECNQQFEERLLRNKITDADYHRLSLDKLINYYKHQLELLQGYERNKERLEEHTAIINGWIRQLEEFQRLWYSPA